MTDLSDPYDVLADLPGTFRWMAEEADRAAEKEKARAEAFRKAEREAASAHRGAEEWRPKPEPAALVVDDAALQRAYAVALDELAEEETLFGGHPDRDKIRAFVDRIIAAAEAGQ